jgi:hypothetical protein
MSDDASSEEKILFQNGCANAPSTPTRRHPGLECPSSKTTRFGAVLTLVRSLDGWRHTACATATGSAGWRPSRLDGCMSSQMRPVNKQRSGRRSPTRSRNGRVVRADRLRLGKRAPLARATSRRGGNHVSQRGLTPQRRGITTDSGHCARCRRRTGSRERGSPWIRLDRWTGLSPLFVSAIGVRESLRCIRDP